MRAKATMSDYDDLIEALLEKRRSRLAFSAQNAREAALLADAIEIRLGAPEGSIRVIDRNGVSGDEANLLALDDPAQVEFTLTMTVEFEMEILSTARVKIMRTRQSDGTEIYTVAGEPVATSSFNEPAMVDTAMAALRLAAMDQKT
jgi:hypothetical protein